MTDLDELMSRDPLELSAQDIDDIIKYHRAQRGRRAAGEKTAKPSIDLSVVTQRLKIKAEESLPTIKRRI